MEVLSVQPNPAGQMLYPSGNAELRHDIGLEELLLRIQKVTSKLSYRCAHGPGADLQRENGVFLDTGRY